MISASRLRDLIRGFKNTDDIEITDVPDPTRRVIDLSDEIAAINRRIRERANPASLLNAADRERLNLLMAELQASRPASKAGR